MIFISGMDWVRAFILLFFLEGAIYVLFPTAIQGYAVRILADAPLSKLRFFGVLLLIIGFILWVVASNSLAGSVSGS